MLDDILDFAAATLVDGGRLAFWMPTANDEEQEIAVPTHPCLRLVVVCVQEFNKCRLATIQLLALHRADDTNRVEETHYLRENSRRTGGQERLTGTKPDAAGWLPGPDRR